MVAIQKGVIDDSVIDVASVVAMVPGAPTETLAAGKGMRPNSDTRKLEPALK